MSCLRLGDWWWRARLWITHPRDMWADRKHARAYPQVGQVIRYHGDLVRVHNTTTNGDDVWVRWYDDNGRHTELVSWLHCCDLP